MIVTLKPFDEYYQKGKIYGRFRASQQVLEASYYDAQEFIRTKRYQEEVDECIERIETKMRKVRLVELFFYMRDDLGAKEEHLDQVFFEAFPPDNPFRVAWEDRKRNPNQWEELEDKLRMMA